ncbi:helix-turn-helix domain-containing protein [Natrialbaceae archaeon AArc-T1-2]|uniref:helix-turn-helix domain-containing protein n=1 Tax=Natrialbaceae archaeon AArc-T1-2 TaxID=3053904 RepID=UPI00255A990D|nr:helix-turn-helix domain-containing protein [Natrialbaceae archaeon AArc-T1-2]WIV67069.1 helix-turn-helix domain-containing protein [Natrialbaceae archaeon AArc-T1-2]
MSTNAIGAGRAKLQSQVGDGVVAAVQLDHPDLLLRPTLRRGSDVMVEPDYQTTVDGDHTLLYLTAYASAFEEFEAGLEDDPTVVDPILIRRDSDRHVYRVTLTDRAITYVPATAEVGGRILDQTGRRDGWTVQLWLPDRDALVALNDRCQDRDVAFQVTYLQTADEENDTIVGLTPEQSELLSVAYEEGYFKVPREISQAELARRFGVSKSAISQRLRRAIDDLCRRTIA